MINKNQKHCLLEVSPVPSCLKPTTNTKMESKKRPVEVDDAEDSDDFLPNKVATLVPTPSNLHCKKLKTTPPPPPPRKD